MRAAQSIEKVQAARAAFLAALSGSNHKASGSAGGYLLAADDWLPAAFSAVDPAGEQEFQLYVDAMERFSIICTVLAPG